MRGIIPHARESRVVLLGAFAIQATGGGHTVVRRTSSSETTGRVVLGDKLGLLVSHLFHCLHIIPLECISLCHLARTGNAPTRSHRHL